MIPSIYRISLDVHDAHSSVCLDMKREDTGRQISITLTDGGFPYHISKECYAVFAATKPDGNIVAHPCEIRGNTILYDVNPQTTAAVGLVECEIKLYGADDKLITSPGFNILVSSTSYTYGDEVESEQHVNVLTHLISEATTVITEGKQVNEDSAELIADMEAKRTVLEQQIADVQKYAKNASNSASLAVLKANDAATSAGNAEAAEVSAKNSASTAVDMANNAYAAQKAAEEAAQRAEEAAQNSGRPGVGITDITITEV